MKDLRAVPYNPRREASITSANDEDDPYRAAARPPEETSCPRCHATYMEGRWTWNTAPKDAFQQLCPACQRIEDKFPAGYVTIRGEFFAEHRDEVVHLITNREKAERETHPLQRIMDMVDRRDGSFEVTTADSHLARNIGTALHDAYKGDLKMRYSRDENLVRATWKR